MPMNKIRKAMVSIEMIVAIGLMLTFIGVIAAIGGSISKLNRNSWQRHTCLAAAQAQMDALAVLGHPIDSAEFERLWPRVKYSIRKTDGQGQWQGLEKVVVQVSSDSGGKTVTLSLTQYMAKDGEVQP